MSDREKVIKGLGFCTAWDGMRQCQPKFYGYDCPYDGEADCKVVLMRDALELLKEQEAKQIVRKQCRKEYDDGSIEYFAEWYCPHCNSLILRGFDNPSIKFCYKCGKPVLWEGR